MISDSNVAEVKNEVTTSSTEVNTDELGVTNDTAIGNSSGIIYFLGLVGLRNLGNTCYMNSALQVVVNWYGFGLFLTLPSHPFTKLFFARLQTLSNKPLAPLSKAYLNLLYEMGYSDEHVSRRSVASPSSLLEAIRMSHPMYRGLSQHDSQEFMRAFLNDLHDELKFKPFDESKFPPIPKLTSCCKSNFIVH